MRKSDQNISQLSERARAVFRTVVESYLESGEPVGSRTLSRQLEENVSAATIRNVMQDLELLGLLDSPHISAGRVPTQQGLRLFVDGILESRQIDGIDRTEIERSMAEPQPDVSSVLDRAASALSMLTRGASLILSPQIEAPIKHLEFVSLAADRVLVVLVTADGQVENRLFTPPPGMTPSAMREAANFLNAVLEGKTLSEAGKIVRHQISLRQRELDTLAANLVEAGIAIWGSAEGDAGRLMVRGASHLLDDAAEADLERIRQLFDDIERKEDLAQLLSLTEEGEGVRVFIGSENKLFSLSGSSLVVSPYMNSDRKIIGAIGVIGPTRLNYARIVPIVDYTAQLVGRIVTDRS